jgi:hypothetical protein
MSTLAASFSRLTLGHGLEVPALIEDDDGYGLDVHGARFDERLLNDRVRLLQTYCRHQFLPLRVQDTSKLAG